MSSPPTPSPASGQPQPLDRATAQLYGQALQALQQQHYGQALRYFQQLYRQKSLPGIYRLKVVMALIRTHQGLGNQALARRLCQQLLTSQSSQVREWAIQVLQTYPSPAVDHRHGPAAEANTSQSLFDYQRLNRLVAEAPGKVNPGNSSGGRFFSLAAHQRLVLHTLQGLTAIALIWLISLIIHSGLWSFNRLMRLISWPIPLYGLPGFDPPTTSLILGLLLILALASPLLMDWMLSRAYGQHPLPLSQLQRDHPDALRLLRRVCQQQGWSLPPLRLLPVTTPLCFSYGWGGGQTRLVVSQGLLKEAASQTLTTLCSYELAHRVNGDLPVMTTLGVLLLGCHRGYCQLAAWSDRHLGVVRWLLTLAAVTCYGGFWGLRQLALALSRCRSRLCDRQVVALTQNPSALQQSLIDLTLALVRDVKRRGNLHPLGLGLEVLLPLSLRSALSPGSFLTTLDWSVLTRDDSANPYRYWLQANSSHPPLGERLQFCQCYPQNQLNRARLSTGFSVARLLGQKSVLVSLWGGGMVVLILGWFGRMLDTLGWHQLTWVYQDSSVLKGLMLLSLGLGILLRINRLYPNIPAHLTSAFDLEEIVVNRKTRLPVEGQPLRLEATLMGSPGLANSLAQQYYLTYGEGLMKLALTTPQLVWLGLADSPCHPQRWLGCQVQVTGWGRRAGGHFWIDVDHLQPLHQFSVLKDQGPLWGSLLSLGLGLTGLFIIFTGN